MSAAMRVAAFAVVVASAFGLGAAIGEVVGPLDVGGADVDAPDMADEGH